MNMGYIYIFLTIVFTVYGQLILKQQVNTVSNMPSGFDLILSGDYLKWIEQNYKGRRLDA